MRIVCRQTDSILSDSCVTLVEVGGKGGVCRYMYETLRPKQLILFRNAIT